MTRSETLDRINATLSVLDDGQLETVADLVSGFATSEEPFRPLTPREAELVEQAKADFVAGRTSTIEESEAFVIAELAKRRAARAGQ